MFDSSRIVVADLPFGWSFSSAELFWAALQEEDAFHVHIESASAGCHLARCTCDAGKCGFAADNFHPGTCSGNHVRRSRGPGFAFGPGSPCQAFEALWPGRQLTSFEVLGEQRAVFDLRRGDGVVFDLLGP